MTSSGHFSAERNIRSYARSGEMSYQEELDRKHINGVTLGTKPFIILHFYTVPVTDLASWRVLSVCTVYYLSSALGHCDPQGLRSHQQLPNVIHKMTKRYACHNSKVEKTEERERISY